MKHFYAFGLMAALALPMQAQTVFESGFENWTDNVPTDMGGLRTNIALDSVFQETENVHAGSFAVRLQLSSGTHKRFTTQPMAVTAGTTYDITFWVRGRGQIRTNIYDGRATGSGYGTYNPYVELTDGATWQEVTQSVSCTNSSAEGEFIFSVINTDGPEHIVIDDVVISAGEPEVPTPATISEIQTSTAPDGASPLDGVLVETSGIVTGVVTNTSGAVTSFFIQDGTGAFSGIYVFGAPAAPVAMGDDVTVVGRVDEFNSLTEIVALVSATVTSSGNPQPTAENLSAADAAQEEWEGVLVRVADIECMNLPDMTNNFQWLGSSWQGDILVDDLMYDSTPTVGTFYSVRGVITFTFGEWKVEPRMASDIEVSTGVDELAGNAVSLFPNPTNGVVTVDLSGITGRTELSLSDASGRVALSAVSSNERLVLDVSTLPTGIYVMTLRNANEVMSTRLSVQH
jgi:hypothetical protein